MKEGSGKIAVLACGFLGDPLHILRITLYSDQDIRILGAKKKKTKSTNGLSPQHAVQLSDLQTLS